MSSAFEFVSVDFRDMPFDDGILKKYLHDSELSRISKAAEKRKQEFLYGRICAKAAYKKLTGRDISYNMFPVRSDSRGSPFLDDGSCFVSITHDSGLAAAIVSNKEKLRAAVDVQRMDYHNTEVIYKFLNEREKLLFNSVSLGFRREFTASAFWTAKEAMSKLFGYGFSMFSALEISEVGREEYVFVNFKNFSGFKVILREQGEFLFAFAAENKEVQIFSDYPLKILTPTELFGI